MQKPNSVPADPIPRFSDIVTVRDAGQLDPPDEAALPLVIPPPAPPKR